MARTNFAKPAALMLSMAAITGVSAAAPGTATTIEGKITDVFGHRAVVETTTGKHLVNIGPRAGQIDRLKPGADIAIMGEVRDSGEVRARSLRFGTDVIALDDARLGAPAALPQIDSRAPGLKPPSSPFGVWGEADARRMASERGFEVSGPLVAEKRHFTGTAVDRDGRSLRIDIHRDGNIKVKSAFLAGDAARAAEAAGYRVVGDLIPEKKHFAAHAVRGEATYLIHIHRDHVKEIRRL
ncbi:MAG: hypothetical protein ACK4MF_02515 [Hyphomicrobiaceae bacterium]